MTIPYINESRQDYIDNRKESALFIAEQHYKLGHELTMWQHLFTWVQCEEIYGQQWDRIRGNK